MYFIDRTKDNSLIYHDREPPIADLAPIEGSVMVKPVPIVDVSTEPTVRLDDFFAALVPYALQQRAREYAERRDALVRDEVQREEDAAGILRSSLESMGLPQAIDAREQPSGLPETVAAHAEEIRSQGGMATLREKHDALLSTAATNLAMLDEGDRLLAEEAADDQRMKERWGTDWSRTGSTALNGKLLAESQKYRDVLNRANASDIIVKERIAKNEPGIAKLSLSDADLLSQLPSSNTASSSASPSTSAATARLRSVLTQLNSVKIARSSALQEIRTAAAHDDITKALIAASSDCVYESFFSSRLQQLYAPLQVSLVCQPLVCTILTIF